MKLRRSRFRAYLPVGRLIITQARPFRCRWKGTASKQFSVAATRAKHWGVRDRRQRFFCRI